MKYKRILGFARPWVERPKLALAVLETESSTCIHISTLDPFLCVKVVPGVLCVLFNRALCTQLMKKHLKKSNLPASQEQPVLMT